MNDWSEINRMSRAIRNKESFVEAYSRSKNPSVRLAYAAINKFLNSSARWYPVRIETTRITWGYK